MTRAVKNYSTQEICDLIDQALDLAFSYFTPKQHGPTSLVVAQACKSVGYDLRRLHIHGLDGIEYLHSHELAFAIGVEVRPSVEWKHDATLRIACQVGWSAGGQQTPVQAVAAAALHLEAATKACQLELALGEVFRAFTGSAAKGDRKAWEAGVSLWRQRNNAAQEKVRAEVARLTGEPE